MRLENSAILALKNQSFPFRQPMTSKMQYVGPPSGLELFHKILPFAFGIDFDFKPWRSR